MFKDIAVWDGEQVQPIWIYADAYKGISEEVSKALYLSLIDIGIYLSGGGRTLLLGLTTESGGCGVTESLSSSIKMLVALASSIVLSTDVCTPNLRHCIKVGNNNNIPT